jgi:hypothetical protein
MATDEEKKDRRPWYEEPGVKIRSAKGATVDVNREIMYYLVTLLYHVETGLDATEIQWAIDQQVSRLRQLSQMSAVFKRNVRSYRRCSRHLFKFLKIADKQGLIERVV